MDMIAAYDCRYLRVLDWTADGSKILFSKVNRINSSSRTDLYMIDTDGSNETNLTGNLDDSATNFIVSPDGDKILFASAINDHANNTVENYDIYVVNTGGSGLTRLTYYQRHNYSNESAMWSPDMSKILFVTFRYSTIGW